MNDFFSEWILTKKWQSSCLRSSRLITITLEQPWDHASPNRCSSGGGARSRRPRRSWGRKWAIEVRNNEKPTVVTEESDIYVAQVFLPSSSLFVPLFLARNNTKLPPVGMDLMWFWKSVVGEGPKDLLEHLTVSLLGYSKIRFSIWFRDKQNQLLEATAALSKPPAAATLSIWSPTLWMALPPF